MNEKQRAREFHIYGLVQGVGFRPFVASLAQKCGLLGWVKNAGGIVTVKVTGPESDIERFAERIAANAPAASQITDIYVSEAPFEEFAGFRIVSSSLDEEGAPVIPPDLPLCEDCKKEMYDPKDRRFKNPFISCVACGPRYSIIQKLPYDRCRTTMDDFEQCDACGKEYRAGGRRDFSQTISCNDCGPYLIFKNKQTELKEGAALKKTAEILNAGGVLAVKGIGGYHFACSPLDESAVQRLRSLKKRDKKPFAVMFKSVEAIKEYCEVSPAEEDLLCSAARPVVLLSRAGKTLDAGVSAQSRYLGAFLPCTPLQELLMDACGPLIMTSANVSGQPILKDDQDVLSIESEFLDGILYNTRKISTRLDDSVMRVAAGRAQVLRRSRGIVPQPIHLPLRAKTPVFAAGADMKAAFCLLADDRAYLSQYLGELQDTEAFESYRKNAERMEKLFSIRPEIAACDLHPDYGSTRFAKGLGLPLLPVQHHHAHIASVTAEHGIAGDVIGVAFDGTGYGEDGATWGGEFMVCGGGGYERAAHLSYLPICGGDGAAKDAKLCAVSYLLAADKGNYFGDGRFDVVRAAVQSGEAKASSSMGRLFDAVSAILGVKEYNSFEGECAIALENLAWRALKEGKQPTPLRFDLRETDGMIKAGQAKLAGEIADAALGGADTGALALGFHRAIAQMVREVCNALREKTKINIVALSGGVFANRLLLEDGICLLEKDGFAVYMNGRVPMNDGGIAMGQAYIAAQKESERKMN